MSRITYRELQTLRIQVKAAQLRALGLLITSMWASFPFFFFFICSVLKRFVMATVSVVLSFVKKKKVYVPLHLREFQTYVNSSRWTCHNDSLWCRFGFFLLHRRTKKCCLEFHLKRMVWPPSEENFTCRYPSGVRQVLLALLFFPSLFHPHLLRLYILPVPLTLAIWFALINRGEYCWHRVFPASKFLCLPYVTPKSYCSNFMDECKAEITLYGNVLIFMAHYRNISEWAVAMLTTDFSFGRRLRKPHIGQYIGITRGRIKSLAEFFF